MGRPYQPLKDDPQPSYDAVVIGVGIGGLICANLLARDGLKVLLVEQHYMVGGYCSMFRRKGYTFDAATHFYPLLGNPQTMTGKLLGELGLTTQWVKMDPVDQFHFPDGSHFSVPADFACYRQQLRAEFPHEVEALDTFFAAVKEAYMYGLLYHFRGRDTVRLDPYRDLTVQQVLDHHFRDRKLKLLLTADCPHWGAPPSRTSFVFDSMLRLSYFLGNFYPRGGSQAFADELAQRLVACGGHILMRSLVKRSRTTWHGLRRRNRHRLRSSSPGGTGLHPFCGVKWRSPAHPRPDGGSRPFRYGIPGLDPRAPTLISVFSDPHRSSRYDDRHSAPSPWLLLGRVGYRPGGTQWPAIQSLRPDAVRTNSGPQRGSHCHYSKSLGYRLQRD
ncbi:hypothetical protein C2W62_07285 [Candidatus Entotheonella serta]|nr:hypothetical protein C2W62_07285 [Candidatus Entotheonella serta]